MQMLQLIFNCSTSWKAFQVRYQLLPWSFYRLLEHPYVTKIKFLVFLVLLFWVSWPIHYTKDTSFRFPNGCPCLRYLIVIQAGIFTLGKSATILWIFFLYYFFGAIGWKLWTSYRSLVSLTCFLKCDITYQFMIRLCLCY